MCKLKATTIFIIYLNDYKPLQKQLVMYATLMALDIKWLVRKGCDVACIFVYKIWWYSGKASALTQKPALFWWKGKWSEACCAVKCEVWDGTNKGIIVLYLWLCSHSNRMFVRLLNLCVVSEDRIRNGCKKIMKSRQGSTQGRLDTFFTVTGSISSKRKVGCNDWN